jgi:hypothetical protein
MTALLNRPPAPGLPEFLGQVREALDNGVTWDCITNTAAALKDDDTLARLAEFRDAETDPDIRDCYQLAIDHLGGAL